MLGSLWSGGQCADICAGTTNGRRHEPQIREQLWAKDKPKLFTNCKLKYSQVTVIKMGRSTALCWNF